VILKRRTSESSCSAVRASSAAEEAISCVDALVCCVEADTCSALAEDCSATAATSEMPPSARVDLSDDLDDAAGLVLDLGDQRGDLGGGGLRALGELADLLGDDREAAALLAGAGAPPGRPRGWSRPCGPGARRPALIGGYRLA
jgi:hypothetical protein